MILFIQLYIRYSGFHDDCGITLFHLKIPYYLYRNTTRAEQVKCVQEDRGAASKETFLPGEDCQLIQQNFRRCERSAKSDQDFWLITATVNAIPFGINGCALAISLHMLDDGTWRTIRNDIRGIAIGMLISLKRFKKMSKSGGRCRIGGLFVALATARLAGAVTCKYST